MQFYENVKDSGLRLELGLDRVSVGVGVLAVVRTGLGAVS